MPEDSLSDGSPDPTPAAGENDIAFPRLDEAQIATLQARRFGPRTAVSERTLSLRSEAGRYVVASTAATSSRRARSSSRPASATGSCRSRAASS